MPAIPPPQPHFRSNPPDSSESACWRASPIQCLFPTRFLNWSVDLQATTRTSNDLHISDGWMRPHRRVHPPARPHAPNRPHRKLSPPCSPLAVATSCQALLL